MVKQKDSSNKLILLLLVLVIVLSTFSLAIYVGGEKTDSNYLEESENSQAKKESQGFASLTIEKPKSGE